MPNWKNLPNEILHIIFKNLKTNDFVERDIGQCALTCGSWRLVAQVMYFSTIRVSSEGDIDNMENLLLGECKSPVGEYVKTLNYKFWDFYGFWARTREIHDSHLLKFNTLFPNLEKIEPSEITDQFYSCFSKLIRDGQFLKMKMLPTPICNKNQSDFYLSCVETIKDRIESISLTRCYHSDQDTFTFLHDKLYQYPRLEYIDIDIASKKPQSILEFTEVLSTKNNLGLIQQLQFRLNFPVNNSKGNEKVYEIQPLRNLKHLLLTCYGELFFFNNDESMLYIMNKFPNLIRLKIRNLHNELTKSLTIPSVISTIRFLKYVSKISVLSIQSIVTSKENISNIITQICTNFKETSTRPSLQYCLNLNWIETRQHKEDFVFVDLELNKHLRFYSIMVRFSTSTTMPFHRKLIEQTGHFFDQLTLFNDYFPACDTISLFLDFIMKHCNQLNQLTVLDRADLEVCEQKAMVKSQSIKSVTIGYCFLSLNTFAFISDRLPYLENLVIDSCKFKNWSHYLEIKMLETSLKSLTINIHIEPDEGRFKYEYKRIYIKLVTSSEKPRLCCLIARQESYEVQMFRLVKCPTEVKFKAKDCLSYFIQCESVKTLIVKFPGSSGNHVNTIKLVAEPQ